MQTNLTLDHVHKTFFATARGEEDVKAVEDMSFSANSGEFVSILGSSGCGKSTILRMIAGLIQPTKGSILMDGQVVSGPSKDRGMVFQEYSLFPFLTVRGNIEFSFKMEGTLADNKEKVNYYLNKIGLWKFQNTFPAMLSGGMRQRVALARTLICNPKILLLDEPLSALDAITRMKMQDEILNMFAENKCLAVMITHDIEEAIYMSSKIILMQPNPGRINKIYDIDLPYNRERGCEEFVNIKKEILHELF